MESPERLLAEFYYRDRLHEAQQDHLVRLAKIGVPRQPSVLFALISQIIRVLRRPAAEAPARQRIIAHQTPIHKAV